MRIALEPLSFCICWMRLTSSSLTVGVWLKRSASPWKTEPAWLPPCHVSGFALHGDALGAAHQVDAMRVVREQPVPALDRGCLEAVARGVSNARFSVLQVAHV